MANYILTLQSKVEALEAALKGIREADTELRVYLASAKFHQDPTVQVQDVLNRLEPIRSATHTID